jgi:O-antigen/teichoic acid export membrane protein
MSLFKTTLHGLIWTFTQQFSVQAINFVVSIILARLLLPSDFGLIGMLTVFIAIGNTLIDGGLTLSLIRTPDANQTDYSVVFLINLAGSITVYLILFFLSPFIADFYHQPLLSKIIRIYTLSFIIGAFEEVQKTKLTKEMNFKLQMIIQVPSLIVGTGVGVVLAYLKYGVWSLVWMNIIQISISTIQLWIRTGWRPDFVFDKEKFKYHFYFGYKLALSGLLNTVYDNVYNLIIGRYFSALQLGYYTRAQSYKQIPVSSISTALDKVTFPMFSSIQGDNQRLKDAYKRLMQQVLFWVSSVLVLLGVIAEPLFRCMLTEKWMPAVPYFQILCIAGIMYPLHSYNLNILKIKGRSDLFLKIEIVKKVLITLGIFCAIPFGIYGLLIFQIFATFLFFGINSKYSGKLIGYPIGEQIRDILPIFLVACTSGVLTFGLDHFILAKYHVVDFCRILISGLTFYSTFLLQSHCFNLSALADFKKLILKR